MESRSYAVERTEGAHQGIRAASAEACGGRIIGDQLLRAATSVAANYRAAGRARSKAEFIAKLGTVQEEADESVFWLEMVIEGGLLEPNLVNDLLAEANELTAIFTAATKSAKRNLALECKTPTPDIAHRTSHL